jgi:hypothetical protein
VRKDEEGIKKTLGDEFFSLFQKNMDRKGIWALLEMLLVLIKSKLPIDPYI